MNAKLHTILSTCLILILTLYQCEASGSKGDATIIATPIGYSNIKGDDSVMDAVRHLKGAHEENVHIRKRADYFTVEVPYAILAGILVYLVTFVALLFLIPAITNPRWNFFKSAFMISNSQFHSSAITTEYSQADNLPLVDLVDKNEQTATHLADIYFPSIACGAILATTLFLALPEAILLIQRGTSSNAGEIEILPGTISRSGAAIMLGFILHLMMEALLPRPSVNMQSDESASIVSSTGANSEQKRLSFQHADLESLHDEDTNDEDDDCNLDEKSNLKDEKSEARVSSDEQRVHYHTNTHRIAILLINSTIHNIFDGFFIGAAFMTCSTATAVCITMITIYREMSSKAADYLFLIQCDLNPTILLIVASGAGLILGISIIIASNLTELTIGVFLAIASGVFLHMSAGICIPRVYSVVKNSRDRWYAIFFLVIGALPVGFTFLNHEHCDA